MAATTNLVEYLLKNEIEPRVKLAGEFTRANVQAILATMELIGTLAEEAIDTTLTTLAEVME